MTVLIVAATAVAGAGAIAALAPLDVRLGLIGLTAALVGAALIADPLPSPAVLAVRLSAALLVVVLLRGATTRVLSRGTGGRGERDSRVWSGQLAGSEIGWPASILLGLAGATAGLAIGVTAFTSGWAAGALTLAGLMLALAVGPVLGEPGGLRHAVAAILITQAALLARNALAGGGSVLDEVVLAAVLASVAAASAAMVVVGGPEGPSPVATAIAAAEPRARPAERPAPRRS